MTPQQREELIEKLCGDWLYSTQNDSKFVWGLFRRGHRGFENYSNEELLAAHREAFDEEFLA